jgi:CRISPR/Cas system-associated exonuclease Cas4 (RecB family)
VAYKRNIFDPKSSEPFKISRSKIDLFLECPRCFYLDARLGVKRPQTPAFTLNSAVDSLLKNEFDLLRKKGKSHELMKKYKIDAVPFDHEDLPLWRGEVNRFSGAVVLDKETNLIIDGLVDDVWIDKNGELLIVDYKSTSTVKEISLEDEYKQRYKTQMEIYQWIFRKMGFKVSDKGYFVFANATKNRPSFDGRLEFEMSIVEHVGDSSWMPKTLKEIKQNLLSDEIPKSAEYCEFCAYRENAGRTLRDAILSQREKRSAGRKPRPIEVDEKRGKTEIHRTESLF